MGWEFEMESYPSGQFGLINNLDSQFWQLFGLDPDPDPK
jgi:hypothetical protein